MTFMDRIKNMFKKGGYALTSESLDTINDHPKINLDPEELIRIENNFREYKNDYPDIEYINSNNQSAKRKYMALNLRKMTAEMMSSLVFNEQTEIKVDTKANKGANDFIQKTFEHNDFKRNLAKYLEPMFAVGGLAARPYVDTSTGEVEFSWALANSFYPLRSNSKGITEGVVVFKTVVNSGKKTYYYTLLEFHEWEDGNIKITNELYESEDSTIVGKRVPLGYNDQYKDLLETATIIEPSKPILNYLKPSGFNNFSLYSPLGIGLCDNSSSVVKQINDTFDQFNWEIRMGQRTVLVSDHMLNHVPDEKNQVMNPVFDPDVNVFKSLRMDDTNEAIKDVTSDIRTDQYISAINQSLKMLEMQMQLSVGTFSFDGKSFKTATEVVSENSLTYRTRNMQCNEVEKFIKGLIVSILEVSKATKVNGEALYNGEIPTFDQISVDFDDGIFGSRDQKLEFYSKAKTVGLVPTTEALKGIFKLTDEESQKWFKRIQMEETGLDSIEIDDYLEKKELGSDE